MRSFKTVSKSEIEITEEDGTVNLWTREDYARMDKKNEYDYNSKIKIKGNWFVQEKEQASA